VERRTPQRQPVDDDIEEASDRRPESEHAGGQQRLDEPHPYLLRRRLLDEAAYGAGARVDRHGDRTKQRQPDAQGQDREHQRPVGVPLRRGRQVGEAGLRVVHRRVLRTDAGGRMVRPDR